MCRIRDVAFEQLVEIRHQTKLGLRYALSQRKHLDCELDVRPMQVMLPYEGIANRKYESICHQILFHQQLEIRSVERGICPIATSTMNEQFSYNYGA